MTTGGRESAEHAEVTAPQEKPTWGVETNRVPSFCPHLPAHCPEFSKWLRPGRLCRLEQGRSEASGPALLFNCWISFFILPLKCLALIGSAISIRLSLRSIHTARHWKGGWEPLSVCNIQTTFKGLTRAGPIWEFLLKQSSACVSHSAKPCSFLPTETLWTREPQNQEGIAGQF